MSKIGMLSGSLAIGVWWAATGAAAQQAAETTEGAAEGPEAASTSVVVDEQQAELERMQREAETRGEPDAEVATADPEQDDRPAGESLHHGSQVGLRVGLAVPYIFAIKYGDGPRCDDEGETFCRRFGALLLDLELAFGVSESVELSLLARLGLNEDDAARSTPLGLGFGARAYGAPHEMFKLFFGGRVMMDVTSSDVPDWNTLDVGLRGELGLQVDFVRYAGAYVQLGETISVLRGLYFTTDLSAGVQARFP